MQGRAYTQRRTREDLLNAVSFFERAVAEDQNHALAYAGLAEAFANLGLRGYMTPVEGRRRSEEAPRRPAIQGNAETPESAPINLNEDE